jgi:hypothetical protein
MGQLKVIRKERIITNVILYFILSFFFLYIQHGYRHHLSPFSLVYFTKSFEGLWFIGLSLFFTSLLLWRHHRSALSCYVFSVFLVSYKLLEGLFLEFNKMIVVTTFIYAIIAYFLYQLLKSYFSLASINLNYSSMDLFPPQLRPISCQVHVSAEMAEGQLTNWDPEGCFVMLDKPLEVTKEIELKVFFFGREFVQKGEVVSIATDKSGIGIKFEKSLKELATFNWAEFIEIVDELGYESQRLR